MLRSGLSGVDNIQVSPRGEVYATLELGGQVVRLLGDEVQVLAEGLAQPDGLYYEPGASLYEPGGSLFVVEEAEEGRVIELDLVTRGQRTLCTLQKPEGIRAAPDGTLLVSEDRREGRVVKLSRDGVLLEVVAHGLRHPEGIAVDAIGNVYVAETKRGRVLLLDGKSERPVVTGLDNPDQLAVDADGGLWITEDAKPGRLLRYRDGELSVIASGLWAPQGIALRGGEVLVAEQARHRILRFLSNRAASGDAEHQLTRFAPRSHAERRVLSHGPPLDGISGT